MSPGGALRAEDPRKAAPTPANDACSSSIIVGTERGGTRAGAWNEGFPQGRAPSHQPMHISHSSSKRHCSEQTHKLACESDHLSPVILIPINQAPLFINNNF